MLSDPQSVTVNAVAKSLPAITRGSGNSSYREANGEHELIVSHQRTKNRERHMVRLNHNKIAADPLTAESVSVSASVYLVIDEPSGFYTDTDLGYLVAGLTDYMTAPITGKILGGES